MKLNNYRPNKKMYDEMVDDTNKLRQVYTKFGKYLKDTSLSELTKLEDFSKQFFMDQGVTFTVYNDQKGVERIFPFDIIPRILSNNEWLKIESGIKQRIKALNLFIKDIYNEQYILKDNVIPTSLILSHENYLLQMNKLKVPHDIYTHISGIDLIRDIDGEFYVLEDNLRTPSGVSYMLQNREISRRLFPSLFPKFNIAPVSDYPAMLYNQLKTLSNRRNPVIVLLTPGLYNSAYYEHTALARLMGVELVQGNDLVVEDNYVYMKTTSGLMRVDIIYRRIDDDYLDPLNFKSNSILGVAGIIDVYREGNIVIVNAPGSGIADDKATYIYVPEMISYYLNEKPILKNIKTYQLKDKKDREYVLDNIKNLVIKRTDGSGGYGMLIGQDANQKEIDDYILKIKKEPNKYIAQPTISLSSTPCLVDSHLSPRCVDLRPFAVYGANGIEVSPGGLTRVALKKGSLVVNSSQGGGSKDTWVLKG